MRLRFVAVSCLVVLGGSLPGLAQQPSGPRTLENLLESEDAEKLAAAAAEAGSTDAGPNRPAGTVTRPKDGVKHPDLDKAWIDYDVAVGKAAESIKAAINKQFDAATAKGDLDAAEKWQAVLARFEQADDLPSDAQIKVTVATAVKDYKKAREELEKAYESVVKSMTMEKKIAEAKAVRAEGVAVINGQVSEDAEKRVPKPGDDLGKQILNLFIGQWRFENGNVEEIAPGGDYLINGNPFDPWGGRWKLDLSDPRGPCVIRYANNGTLTHWFIDPEKPTVMVSEKGGKVSRIGPPRTKPR